MKAINITRTLFVIAGMILFTSTTLWAGNTAKAPAKALRSVISESVKFPETINKDDLTGTVEVVFSVNEKGKIEISRIKSENQQIIDAVTKQLGELSCNGLNCPTYQQYRIEITFKLV